MSTMRLLKRPARRRLQKLDRERPSADVRVRIRVSLKVAAGLSCNAAAREVGCVPSTAVRIVARLARRRVTQAWLAEFGEQLRLHFLPPYCPNENRIERLRLDLHANVTGNHRQSTIGALLARVHRYLADRMDIRRRARLAA